MKIIKIELTQEQLERLQDVFEQQIDSDFQAGKRGAILGKADLEVGDMTWKYIPHAEAVKVSKIIRNIT